MGLTVTRNHPHKTMQPQPQKLKTALFVDFDNIYLGLKQLDETAAERFAADPGRWLAWMEQGMPTGNETHADGQPLQRHLLIRRCYLNPRDFSRYRPNFTRSAFNVIDCPSLTQQGKNSADIYMVMDIVDTLEHKTHFDEFIILSGDADFTPVLLRLRAHDRRTVVLAAGPASEAYKAACNQIIAEDVFIEYALGMSAEGEKETARPGATIAASDDTLDRMAAALYAEASANGEILATDLPRLYISFPEFRRDANWLGFFSLRALTVELARRRNELHVTEGDPWRVTVEMPARKARSRRRKEPERAAPAAAPAASPGPNGSAVAAAEQEQETLRHKIVQLVQRMVAEAEEPILMAKAAHDVTQKLGPQVIESHWAGAGTFKNLLMEEEIDIEIAPSPGYLYDPRRHQPPTAAVEEAPALPAGLPDLIARVAQATGTPDLTPKQYAVLFTAIADALKQESYNLTTTSKTVRDLSIERGESISRSIVSFVLKGILYRGHRFSRRDTPLSLARHFRNSVVNRCQDTELELTKEDLKLMDLWFLSGFKA